MLNSSLVGRELHTREHRVSWRETTNYAAAVGDNNPRYFDDTRKGGIVAPPLFAVALTWPIIAGINEEFKTELTPEIIPTMVHASEHLIFHRPVRPGDLLRISGRVSAIVPTGAGTLFVLKFSAKDRDDMPVFTEFNGAIFRGVKCADEGRKIDDPPAYDSGEYPDPPVWSEEIHISHEMPYIYDGCTDIVFPIHTSPAFAKAAGLPGIILQGTATLALAAREILDREAGGTPESLKEIACRFTSMVPPGTDIRVELCRRHKQGGDLLLGFRVMNSQGAAALSRGYARLAEDD